MESLNFEQRKDILKYDNVLSKQREVIYASRRLLIEKNDVTKQLSEYVNETLGKIVNNFFSKGYSEDWDYEKFLLSLKELYPTKLTIEDILLAASKEKILELLVRESSEIIKSYGGTLGAELLQQVERQILLNSIDSAWRSHLYEMDYLQEGIGLRAMAQRDPLVEYQNEGYHLFTSMLEQIKENAAHMLLNLVINVEKEIEKVESQSAKLSQQSKNAFVNNGSSKTNPNTPSRNSLCSCGSGKKYKRCHGEKELSR